MLAVIIEQEETDLLRPQNYKQQKIMKKPHNKTKFKHF